MPRIRSLKYEYFVNEDLAQISTEARLLGLGLTTIADREGRLEDRPLRIKVFLFPYHNVDIDALLNELQSANFLKRYTVDAQGFIQITNFLKHQKPHPKEQESILPGPEKVGTSRGRKRQGKPRDAADEAQGKPCKVVNGSRNGLGDLGSGGSGSLGSGNGSGSGHTHTDREQEPVCVPKSKFGLEEIRKFAWASWKLDQRLISRGDKSSEGIRNPDGWAIVAHRSGEFDLLIQEFVDNPRAFEVSM